MKKKIITLIGNALMLIAIVLMIWKTIHLDIDYSVYFNKSGIIWMVLLSVLYAILLIIMSLSWRQISSTIVDKPIKFWICSKVYCKSNLLKYIPGNIFQYMGRIELAERLELGHTDVALATGIDVFIQFFSFFIVSIVFCGCGFLQIMKINTLLQKFLPIAILICLISLGILVHFIKIKHKEKINYYRALLVRKNIPVLLKCISRYIFIAIGFGIIYLLIISETVTFPVNMNEYLEIFGIFILSWLFGFITPGAPGGIGIREAVLTLLLGSKYDITPFLSGVIIYRLINSLGDFIAYITTTLGEKIWKQNY